MMTDHHLTNHHLAAELGDLLKAHGLVLTLAESCTGGGLSSCITEIAGSSAWFDRAFITYSNQAKIQMLGVSTKTLDNHGAVSENTALEMALGALANSAAQVSASITGVAGPAGGTALKPVGMVCFGFALNNVALNDIDSEVSSRTHTAYFEGDRESIRLQAIHTALLGLISLLKNLTLNT